MTVLSTCYSYRISVFLGVLALASACAEDELETKAQGQLVEGNEEPPIEGKDDKQPAAPLVPQLDAYGLPTADVSCETKHNDDPVLHYEYDAETRTLTSDRLQIVFDAEGRYVTRGEPSGEWLHAFTYDEHGQRVQFEYFWGGQRIPRNCSTSVPRYDAQGVVTGVTTFDGGQQTHVSEYHYESGRLDQTTTTTTSVAGTFEPISDVIDYRYDAAGRLVETNQEGRRVAYAYDAAGRLTDMKTDGQGRHGASDGTFDVHDRWVYDAAGRLLRFEQDGNSVLDAPFIDGTLDHVRTFSAGCAALQKIGAKEIFALPPPPEPS